MAQATGPLDRIRSASGARRLPLPGFPGLDFRTALPPGLEWFEDDHESEEFAASGMFERLERVWLGYEPAERDRLEIAVWCARIRPERAALASDYARLLAMVWGPLNFGIDGAARDFGEVLAGESDTGFDRRLRISVWRRGLELLIIAAQTTLEDFEAKAPLMAALVGSLEFEAAVVPDPVIASLVAHHLPLSDGSRFAYLLPSHWPLWQEDANARLTARIHIDEADEGRSGAIGLFTTPVPANAPPDQAPLRQIATGTSELMLMNLLPGTRIERKPMNESRMPGFAATPAQGMFGDALLREDGVRLGATGFFIRAEHDVPGYSALSAWPEGQPGMGRMMHVNFVQRLVTDSLRDRFGG